jgi:folate-binding protein YgfZ
MYILRAKVVLKDLSLSHACIGVYGPDATTHLDTYHLALPDLPNTVSQQDSVWITHLHPNRYFVVAPQTTPADHLAGAEDAWNLLDIEAGIPWITPEIQDEFTPQMVNLDLIGALSFTKGCYPGQEIVARSQYLGKLKRRMLLAHCEQQDHVQVKSGDEIFSEDEPTQPCGLVVNAEYAPDGRIDCLIEVKLETLQQKLRLHTATGPQLHLDTLPYSIPELE